MPGQVARRGRVVIRTDDGHASAAPDRAHCAGEVVCALQLSRRAAASVRRAAARARLVTRALWAGKDKRFSLSSPSVAVRRPPNGGGALTRAGRVPDAASVRISSPTTVRRLQAEHVRGVECALQLNEPPVALVAVSG
jgi:hypothetical protein